MNRPDCKLCASAHWDREPHAVSGVKVRASVREFLSVTNRKEVVTTIRNTCLTCGSALIQPKRGRAPTYCSAKCRVRASRA